MEFLPKNICTTRFTLRSRVTALKRSPSTRNLENPNSGAFGSRFRFEDYAGKDPFGFVRSLNLSRRHLTLAQKKEVAKHIFEREPGRSDRSVGEELGLSHTTVAKVREEVDAEPNGQNGHKDSSAATPVASNSQNGNKKDVRVECDGDHHARISQDRSQARSVLSAGKETPRPAGHFR